VSSTYLRAAAQLLTRKQVGVELGPAIEPSLGQVVRCARFSVFRSVLATPVYSAFMTRLDPFVADTLGVRQPGARVCAKTLLDQCLYTPLYQTVCSLDLT
jgi:hypothetical protein